MRLRQVLLLIAIVSLTGCMTLTREAVFSDVQRIVHERTGKMPELSNEETAVQAVIDEYLKDEITVDEAVKIALLNNQELQASYDKLGIARGQLIDAGLLRNPIFEAEVHFEGGGLGTGTNLNLIQEFISVFQLPLRNRVAEASLEAVKLDVAKEVLDLIYETKKAFYSVQGAEQLFDLSAHVMESLEASAEITKRQKQAGNITSFEYVSETVLYAKARRELADVKAALFDEREKLNLLLGLWGKHTDWSMHQKLPEPSLEDLKGIRLESLAVSRRPELLQARSEIEALATQYGITQGFRLIPEFELGVDLEGEDNSKTIVGPNLSLPLPIFNQGQGLIVQAEARLRQVQRKYVAEAVKIRSEVRSALNRLTLAREQVTFDKKHLLPLTDQAVHNAQLEYNAMLIGVFDLLRAKQEEIEAGHAYIEALRDYWIAKAELEKAIGGSLPTEMPHEETKTASK